jgi:hypothetical protein
MANEKTLELSRAINDERQAWNKLLGFATKMNTMNSPASSIVSEFKEIAIDAVHVHDKVERISRLGSERKPEEDTINRLEGTLDMVKRVAEAEDDAHLANDYGGLGYEKHKAVQAVYDMRSHIPWDLREGSWSVAVHNDYHRGGVRYTFWLFTHSNGRYVKGEGRTDKEALDQIREQLRSKEKTS